MGPISRYWGPWVPPAQLWQDPVPPAQGKPIDAGDIKTLKEKILSSGIGGARLIATAWAAASSFRGTDKRGGANGGRLRLSPQRNWEVNEPKELEKVLPVLEKIQNEFNKAASGKSVSLADLIVLGGCAAIEDAAKKAGHNIEVPFSPGRTDASQDQTDAHSFAVLEPKADGFRNYVGPKAHLSPETLLLDRANLLKLTAPEMTVLIGGLRVLGVNHDGTAHGVFTDKPGTLTNDFFTNLLDMGTVWDEPSKSGVYVGKDSKTGKQKWTATAVDLVFGSHAQLRAFAEVYASDDAKEKFIRDFVAAWNKVMNLDRYDLLKNR